MWVLDDANGKLQEVRDISNNDNPTIPGGGIYFPVLPALRPSLFSSTLLSYGYSKVFWAWNILLILLLLLNRYSEQVSKSCAGTILSHEPLTVEPSQGTRPPKKGGVIPDTETISDTSELEALRAQFGKFRRYIYLRELIFTLFMVEVIGVMWTTVYDQSLMPDVSQSSFLLVFRVDEDRVASLRSAEVLAITAHLIAILLGCILVHNSYYAPNIFLKLGYAIRMREIDESAEEVQEGSAIKFEKILKYAKSLKDTWRNAYSIIDLVDVTDFYLLLFDNDFYEAVWPIREKQRNASILGLCDWEYVRIYWLVAFFTCTLGNVLDESFMWLAKKMNKGHYFRWSEMPNGMRFWQLYVIKREDEKRKKEDEIRNPDEESSTGPYPESWSAACKYFDFNLPRKKNQQEFAAATRSLFFVEIPFLYWRLTCSEKYGVVASSLVIKNILSMVYDFYIFIWGVWKLYGMIWRRIYCADYKCCNQCDHVVTDLEAAEESDAEEAEESGDLAFSRQRSTRIMGAKSWLTTEQLMHQPQNEWALDEYHETGIVPPALYSDEIYGANVREIGDDDIVKFLDQTGMVA
jgi:hypothetical protein